MHFKKCCLHVWCYCKCLITFDNEHVSPNHLQGELTNRNSIGHPSVFGLPNKGRRNMACHCQSSSLRCFSVLLRRLSVGVLTKIELWWARRHSWTACIHQKEDRWSSKLSSVLTQTHLQNLANYVCFLCVLLLPCLLRYTNLWISCYDLSLRETNHISLRFGGPNWIGNRYQFKHFHLPRTT